MTLITPGGSATRMVGRSGMSALPSARSRNAGSTASIASFIVRTEATSSRFKMSAKLFPPNGSLLGLHAGERLGHALVVVFRRRAGNPGAAEELAVHEHRRAAGTAPECVRVQAGHADDKIVARIVLVSLHRLFGVAFVGHGGFRFGEGIFLAEAAARPAHARVGGELPHLVDDRDEHFELHLGGFFLDPPNAFFRQLERHSGHGHSPFFAAGFSASAVQILWPVSGTRYKRTPVAS